MHRPWLPAIGWLPVNLTARKNRVHTEKVGGPVVLGLALVNAHGTMPSTVKLGSADHRAWRMNRAHWVSPAGRVVRVVEPKEEDALSLAKKRVRAVGKSGTARIPNPTGGPNGGPSVVQFEIVKTGPKRDAFVIETYLEGDRYVRGRDIIIARIVAQHGECILLGTNGKRLIVARDQRRVRALADARTRAGGKTGGHVSEHLDDILDERGLDPVATGPHYAKLPGSRSIHHRRVGRHRMVKKSSRVIADATLAPDERDLRRVEDGQVMHPKEAELRDHLRTPTAEAARAQQSVRLQVRAFNPEECPNNCRGFADGTEGWSWPAAVEQRDSMHHPTCAHAGAWKRSQDPGPARVLYDLDRRRELRPATDEEVAEAENHAARYGTPAVTIGSRQYAVIEQGEFDVAEQPQTPAQAKAEARPLHPSVAVQHQRGADRQEQRAASLRVAGDPGFEPQQAAPRQPPPPAIATAVGTLTEPGRPLPDSDGPPPSAEEVELAHRLPEAPTVSSGRADQQDAPPPLPPPPPAPVERLVLSATLPPGGLVADVSSQQLIEGEASADGCVDYDELMQPPTPRAHRKAAYIPADVSPEGVIADSEDTVAAAIIAAPAQPYQAPEVPEAPAT